MRYLWVAGPALRGSGYPNAQRTLEILGATGEWEIHDHAHWLPAGTRLWRSASGGMARRLAMGLHLGLSGWWQAVKAILGARQSSCVYVPYPAPLTLWWMSFCPRRWRPRCVADAYISIWDSMFRDRKYGAAKGVLSSLVWRFERRGLRAAERVVVDTEANRLQMVADFGLDPGSVVSFPLAIDEELFLRIAPLTSGQEGPLRVLFVGTLVALHGIETVLGAIDALADDPRFEFRLVGDGQMGGVVESFVARRKPQRFTWVREWQGLPRIASEIEAADICLGVFGAEGKAARVLPFKLYMYLAAGRPIITQEASSTPQNVPRPPCKSVDARQVSSLVHALEELAVSSKTRIDLAKQSRQFYLQWIANDRLAECWRLILLN